MTHQDKRSFQRPLSFTCEPRRTVSHCPGATRLLAVSAGIEPAPFAQWRFQSAALPTELRNHAPVGCVDPPGNRKGSEGEKWHLTQEAGGFYPANFIQAYFIKRIQWVSVIFVMFYIKSHAPFFRHPPPRGSAGIASQSCTTSSWRGRGDVCI